MKEPLVSIIVPAYNVEKYVEKCVLSILNQSYKNLEILVVNDGCTDNSMDVVKTIDDSRIKILNKSNGGISDTRNYGLKHASGEYIYFIDSDDWIESNFIDTAVSLIMEKDSDIIYFNFFIDTYSENNDLITGHSSGLHQIVDEDEKLLSVIGYVWNKFYKKSFLEDNFLIFNKDIRIYEDIDFNLKCFSKATNIIFINDVFYHYNNRLTGSLIKSYNPQNIMCFNEVQKTLKEYLTRKDYSKALLNSILSKYLLMTLRHQLNTVFKFANMPFWERTDTIRSVLNELENIAYLEYYKPSNLKELIICKLALGKLPLLLNIVLSIKK